VAERVRTLCKPFHCDLLLQLGRSISTSSLVEE
jgi:hypothetical protein